MKCHCSFPLWMRCDATSLSDVRCARMGQTQELRRCEWRRFQRLRCLDCISTSIGHVELSTARRRAAYRSRMRKLLLLEVLVAACAASQKPALPPRPDEPHLADVRRLTQGGQNAEAYWAFDGSQLSFQARREGEQC